MAMNLDYMDDLESNIWMKYSDYYIYRNIYNN